MPQVVNQHATQLVVPVFGHLSKCGFSAPEGDYNRTVGDLLLGAEVWLKLGVIRNDAATTSGGN